MRLIALALLIALSSTPTLAQQNAEPVAAAPDNQPAPNQADAAPKGKQKEERICRKTRNTGSRMPVRTCRTQAQWDAVDGDQQSVGSRLQGVSKGG